LWPDAIIANDKPTPDGRSSHANLSLPASGELDGGTAVRCGADSWGDGHSNANRQNTTVLPEEGVAFRMAGRWMSGTGRDLHLARSRHINSPILILRTDREITEVGFRRGFRARKALASHSTFKCAKSPSIVSFCPFHFRWSFWYSIRQRIAIVLYRRAETHQPRA